MSKRIVNNDGKLVFDMVLNMVKVFGRHPNFSSLKHIYIYIHTQVEYIIKINNNRVM